MSRAANPGGGFFKATTPSGQNLSDYIKQVGDGQYVKKLTIASLPNAANDTAAANAGVAVGEPYRNGSVLMVRVT